jgi:hypothetical protein
MAAIEVLDIALAEVAHQTGASCGFMRSDQQVHMVRHQAVRMYAAIVFLGQLPQMSQVHKVVAVLPEAGHAVVAALNDMDGHTGQDQPQGPGHAQ